eukprot:Skav227097  [mRNA]  locus=scaffold199:26190:27674:+ [translate_table: standard]
MKQQQVYVEVNINTLTPEQRKQIIQSRWVLKDKSNTVRARLVAKGYTETIADIDSIYASTPIYSCLRTLLAISLSNSKFVIITGDISTAFLHAIASTTNLYMYPPAEFYNKEDGVVWKLNKSIYGLRSSPKQWQQHLADTLQQLGLQRSVTEPNIYYTPTRDCYILVYVDDLLFAGEEPTVNRLFKAIQQHLLLRPTGKLDIGNTVTFLGRNITNRGDHYEVCLADNYTTTLLEEMGLNNSKPTVAPGTSALKTLSADTPTEGDQQNLKHLLRYISGTKHYKQVIRPTATTTPDINVYVDSDWAGCQTTRKSTTGFATIFDTVINYGSRKQATIALSSAEAELYAINTGSTEALHARNLLLELLNSKKINIKIHTDSSAGKSMATRIGSSKKAKHIDIKHLFIQQLVAYDIVRILKIHTNNNPADILTKYVSTETLQRHLHNVGLKVSHTPF